MKLTDLRVDDGLPHGRAAITFAYTAKKLAAASLRQALFHREREQYYTEEATRLEEELRRSGMELREQNVTGGPQFTAVFDSQLGQQLTDARLRRDRHATAMKKFDTYAGAFAANAGTNEGNLFWLTIDDVYYFALHREPGE